MWGDLTPIAVTHSNILTSILSTSSRLSRFGVYGTLSYHLSIVNNEQIRSFGTMFSPVTLSAQKL